MHTNHDHDRHPDLEVIVPLDPQNRDERNKTIDQAHVLLELLRAVLNNNAKES